MAETKLCPKCGAYWQCNCQREELVPLIDTGCAHDWTEAVGVELDSDLMGETRVVVVCRLCGLYAVEEDRA
jgi:hypothetical protein